MFKLNKQTTLIAIILIALITIFLLVYFLFIRNNSATISTPTPKANKPEIESRVTILQNDVYLFDFSTEEIKETKNLVHLRIWPVLSFTTNEEIKDLKIKNIYVNSKYESAIIYPGHIPNNKSQYNILFGEKEDIKEKDIKNYGTTLEYNVVESAGYYDEVYKTSGIPQWLIVLKNMGEYNYTEIYNRDRFWDGGKILEYANINGSDLNMSFHFDLEILFEDGEKYIKRFSSTIDGEKYLQDQFYNPKLIY